MNKKLLMNGLAIFALISSGALNSVIASNAPNNDDAVTGSISGETVMTESTSTTNDSSPAPSSSEEATAPAASKWPANVEEYGEEGNKTLCFKAKEGDNIDRACETLKGESIQTIVFLGKNYEKDDIKKIVSAIEENKNIKRLFFIESNIYKSDIESILNNDTGIKEIRVRPGKDDYTREIITKDKNGNTVKKIEVYYKENKNGKHVSNIPDVCETLKENSDDVKILDLFNATCSAFEVKENLKKINEMLASNTSLEKLILPKLVAKYKKAREFISSNILKTLNITTEESNNDASTSDATINETLKELHIPVSGSLIHVMKRDKDGQFKKIIKAVEAAGDDAAIKAIEELTENYDENKGEIKIVNVETLDFHNAFLSTKGAEAIAKILKSNKSLKRLILTGNNLPKQFIKPILDVMINGENTTLKEIYISKEKLYADDVKNGKQYITDFLTNEKAKCEIFVCKHKH